MKPVREFVQTFMIFLVPLASLLIHGCAPLHLNPDEYDRICSGGFPGWFRCLAEVEVSPTARNELKEHSTIRVIQHPPALHLPILEPNEIDSDYKITMTDPLSSVKAHFLAMIQAELGLSNFDVAQDPHPTDRLGYFKQLFGKGLVLDFGSVRWALIHAPDLAMALKIGPSHYVIEYTVRARLIRAEGPTLLWQKVCFHKPFRTEQKYTLAEWHANDDLLLKVNAEEEARKCADQLAASFLGKRDSR